MTKCNIKARHNSTMKNNKDNMIYKSENRNKQGNKFLIVVNLHYIAACAALVVIITHVTILSLFSSSALKIAFMKYICYLLFYCFIFV